MKLRNSLLTKEYILSKVSQAQIFSKFLDLSNIDRYLRNDNTMFVNKSRYNDDSNTCTFKVYSIAEFPYERIWFRDWADSKGYDCFGLVQYLYYNCSFYDALEVIAKEFNLLDLETFKELQYVIEPKRQLEVLRAIQPPRIRIKSVPFSQKDINYWKQYNLDIEDLEGDIKAIKCYWFNEARHDIELTEIVYAYDFDNYNYKLYFPNRSKKEIRFLHNNAQIFQGESKLKFDKDLLIITSSYKDCKVLRKIEKIYNLNFETIAPMSETTLPKNRLNFLKTKYKNTLLYHNNDEAGLRAMKAQSEKHNLEYIFNPLDLPKDISDIVKLYGFDKAVETIHNLLYE